MTRRSSNRLSTGSSEPQCPSNILDAVVSDFDNPAVVTCLDPDLRLLDHHGCIESFICQRCERYRTKIAKDLSVDGNPSLWIPVSKKRTQYVGPSYKCERHFYAKYYLPSSKVSGQKRRIRTLFVEILEKRHLNRNNNHNPCLTPVNNTAIAVSNIKFNSVTSDLHLCIFMFCINHCTTC